MPPKAQTATKKEKDKSSRELLLESAIKQLNISPGDLEWKRLARDIGSASAEYTRQKWVVLYKELRESASAEDEDEIVSPSGKAEPSRGLAKKGKEPMKSKGQPAEKKRKIAQKEDEDMDCEELPLRITRGKAKTMQIAKTNGPQPRLRHQRDGSKEENGSRGDTHEEENQDEAMRNGEEGESNSDKDFVPSARATKGEKTTMMFTKSKKQAKSKKNEESDSQGDNDEAMWSGGEREDGRDKDFAPSVKGAKGKKTTALSTKTKKQVKSKKTAERAESQAASGNEKAAKSATKIIFQRKKKVIEAASTTDEDVGEEGNGESEEQDLEHQPESEKLERNDEPSIFG